MTRRSEGRKRSFFRAASSAWLNAHRDGLVRETLLDERARGRGIFAPRAVESLVEQSRGTGRAGEPLLAVLLLELWHREFVDADGPSGKLIASARQGGRASLTPRRAVGRSPREQRLIRASM